MNIKKKRSFINALFNLDTDIKMILYAIGTILFLIFVPNWVGHGIYYTETHTKLQMFTKIDQWFAKYGPESNLPLIKEQMNWFDYWFIGLMLIGFGLSVVIAILFVICIIKNIRDIIYAATFLQQLPLTVEEIRSLNLETFSEFSDYIKERLPKNIYSGVRDYLYQTFENAYEIYKDDPDVKESFKITKDRMEKYKKGEIKKDEIKEVMIHDLVWDLY